MKSLIVEFLDFCQELDITAAFTIHQEIEMIRSWENECWALQLPSSYFHETKNDFNFWEIIKRQEIVFSECWKEKIKKLVNCWKSQSNRTWLPPARKPIQCIYNILKLAVSKHLKPETFAIEKKTKWCWPFIFILTYCTDELFFAYWEFAAQGYHWEQRPIYLAQTELFRPLVSLTIVTFPSLRFMISKTHSEKQIRQDFSVHSTKWPRKDKRTPCPGMSPQLSTVELAYPHSA